ncbi:PDZ domain-containing protein [Seonamhaeicola algicola]|uniref:PDZ domain-containing protein n=1 Tax=Seonamhaeicola algicola TaxID=1719036 RepID=A0A5C7AMS4_9FLAO|nr:PDZ domain-containing protein [Seonamhaeicola algicola]TXE07132.1 PDZ domain-containing protein [Seonamhaeicola algicola]
MKKRLVFFCLFSVLALSSFAQSKFVIQNKKQSDKIDFKLIHNLMVVPVQVNGVALSFILDTGVSKPIIFNFLNGADTLKVKNTETLFLRGLGDGEPVEALKSSNNIFKIGEAININQHLYAIFGLDINFAPRLGIPIHGIIGLDLFKDFIVEINYRAKYIRLHEPNVYKYKTCKKCERFNLEFYNDKPYINAHVNIQNKKIPVKLLIDSGGSDSLWLFEDDAIGIQSGNAFFRDFLGHGLSGSVYGKRTKVDTFYLKNFKLKHANVAYPDATSIAFAKRVKERNGSIAGNILKRFNVIVDYKNSLLTLKKNANFKDEFRYNNSGIELAHSGVRFVKEYDNTTFKPNENRGLSKASDGVNVVLDRTYRMALKPAYAIVELRENSPAKKAGLQKGDVILTINGKTTHQLKLQQIMHMFYGNIGKLIKLKVERGNTVLSFNFRLEKPY